MFSIRLFFSSTLQKESKLATVSISPMSKPRLTGRPSGKSSDLIGAGSPAGTPRSRHRVCNMTCPQACRLHTWRQASAGAGANNYSDVHFSTWREGGHLLSTPACSSRNDVKFISLPCPAKKQNWGTKVSWEIYCVVVRGRKECQIASSGCTNRGKQERFMGPEPEKWHHRDLWDWNLLQLGLADIFCASEVSWFQPDSSLLRSLWLPGE